MAQKTVGIDADVREMLREMSRATGYNQKQLVNAGVREIYRRLMPDAEWCNCGLGDDEHEIVHPAYCNAHTKF